METGLIIIAFVYPLSTVAIVNLFSQAQRRRQT